MTCRILQFLVLAIFCLGGGARGQTVTNAALNDGYLINVWDSERGLPENSVVSLAQTLDGYLWLGTLQAGIARFDGMRFTSFNPVNVAALPRVDIQQLLVDSEGVLWIAMVGGTLARYEAGQFTLESSFSLSGRDAVTTLVASRTNEVIFATKLGELIRGRRRPGTNSLWEKIKLPNANPAPQCRASSDGRIWYRQRNLRLSYWRDGMLESNQPNADFLDQKVTAIRSDSEGRVWVGTERGLARWEDNVFVNMTPTNAETDVAVQDFVFAGDGGVWVRTNGRMRKSFARQWIAEAQGWSEVPIGGAAELQGDHDGGVWLRNRNQGVWHVQPDGKIQSLNDKNGLPNGLIDCLMPDSEGNIWLGIEGGGLVRVRPRHFEILHRPDSAAGAVVRSVCEDADGSIWLGGSDGKVFQWQNKSFQEIVFPKTTLPVRDVTLWPDEQNGMWVGTVQNGAWLWNSNTLRQPFPADAIGTVVRVFFKDRHGIMWLGNEFGLYRWNDGKLEHFTQAQGFQNGEYVLAIADDAEGSLWIGTADGHLWRFKAGVFTLFTLPSPSPNFRFWSLLTEADGTVWVGTLGGGLLRWRDGQLTRCTSADGLSSDTISQLLKDHRGNIWAGSRAGIFAMERAGLNDFFEGKAKKVFCRTYGVSDGLPALECSGGYQPACWHAHDGRLWFATVKGVVSVEPEKLPANPLPPKIAIEEMSVDGSDQEIRPGNPDLIIAPGRHYVQFRFTGLSFTAPERVRFQWQLEGLEPNWVDGGNQRSVSYSYLPPGKYTFKVRAGNSDGIWNQTGAAFSFRVLPHFWETWWFHVFAPVLTIFITGGITLLIIRRRYKSKLARIEQQRAIERERTRIAQDLHDDLGASLTQVAWLGEAASSEGLPADESQKLVAKITLKSREMVRAIDEIVWAVNPKNDSLDHLVTYICECADQIFRNSPTRCRVDVPEIVPAHALSSDVRHNLFLAAKEALHNVAKHAGASEVFVRVKVEADVAQIAVEDNGRGFVPGKKTSGDGLENMHQRSTAIGADFTLHSVPGQGTSVIWKLRLERDKHKAQNHPKG